MKNWYFKEFTRFAAWGKKGDFIYKIDIKTFFNRRNQGALANYRNLTFVILVKSNSEKVSTQKRLKIWGDCVKNFSGALLLNEGYCGF